MSLEDLFLWVRRDASRRRNHEEGIRIIQRLRELADYEHVKQIKPAAAESFDKVDGDARRS